MEQADWHTFQSIPGQPAPASLKLARLPDLELTCPHSGAACPGLIEARHRSSARQCSRALHSGAACPGLIEAGRIWRPGVGMAAGIPGQPAPASLKPSPASESNGAESSIPGQPAPASLKLSRRPEFPQSFERHSGAACPGLIEAIETATIRCTAAVRIPGQPAPASLKHLLKHDEHQRNSGIPGQPAPASLKRGNSSPCT